MSPSLIIVKVKKSSMKMISKDERPVKPNWMRITESSVKLKKERLELVVSFDLKNTQDSQLDIPIIPKAFRFRAFVKIVKAPITDNGADHMLFSFYLKHMKPQYETWCASKITVMKVIGLIDTNSFPNAEFKIARVYQSREQTGADFRTSCISLPDKHLYPTSRLEFILDLVTKFKGNSKEDLKCFSDSNLWYIHIPKLLLCFILKTNKKDFFRVLDKHLVLTKALRNFINRASKSEAPEHLKANFIC
ncbi:unnamed protein product [Lactuca saligna]|uniref:Uncharacterized protein n=1 Tax=Lactuca saligna TaxID=75948 RepID=A0AA36E860_LACSI|nr:unnamed protein product [Lactuca saligna]